MAKIIVNKKNIDIIINAKKIFPTLENLEITPRAFEQKFNHPNSYGYNEITVKAMKINLQDKEITPTKETQEITADNNYNGLSKVTVNKIPDEYIIPAGSVDITTNGTYDVTDKVTANVNIPMPTGTIEITENGTHNVKDKEFANVNVQPVLQEKTVTIVENGTTITQNDSEYDGLSKVTTIVNVPEKQLGTKTITSNGLYKATDDNLDGYSEVNVETSGVDINNYWDMEKNIRNFKPIYFIKNIPLLKTSNTVSMSSAFSQFSTLQTIPELDTSNVTDMNNMFYSCSSLPTIPLLNTTKVTNMSNMFYECSILSEIPELDTPNVTNMNYMFYGCKVLKKIPKLKANSVKELMNCFVSCNELENFGGLENIGEAYLTTKAELYSYYTIALNYSTKLTHESLMNVINNLYDIKTAGVKTQRLILTSESLSKLTADEIAIATSKGFSVS